MLDRISDSITWPEGVWSGCLNTAMLGCSSSACLVCSEHTEIYGQVVFRHGWKILTCQNGGYLFVDNDVYFDSPLRSGKKHSVDSIILILAWRSSQIKLCHITSLASILIFKETVKAERGTYRDSTTNPKSRYSPSPPQSRR